MATIFSLIHHYQYSYDGQGFRLAEVLNIFCEMTAECIMTILLYLLVDGWMTRWIKYDSIEKKEVYVPIFVFILLVHLIMGGLTFID